LDNLKKMGFLRTKTKNRKKYYYVNKDFIIFEELKSIFIKVLATNKSLANDIEKMGDVKFLLLSGQFIEKPTENVDMLIVGNIDKDKFSKYLNDELRTERSVKFTILSEDDYKYRLNCKDQFITNIINDSQNQILINKIT
jgi:hypothetical protein